MPTTTYSTNTLPRLTRPALAAAALCPLAGLAGLAGAAMPRALDLVPADAPFVVSTDNMGALIDDLNTLNRSLGERANAELNLGLAFIGNMPGLDKSGSLAFVLVPRAGEIDDAMDAMEDAAEGDDMDFGDDDGPDMTGYIIAPVADFAAFTTGWKNGPDGIKIGEFDGNPVYAKDLEGDFALLAPEMEIVASTDATPGKTDAIKSRIGPVGGRLAETTELFIFGDPALLEDAVEEGSEGVREQAQMASAMGGVDVSGTVNTSIEMAETFVRDGQVFALGFSLTDAGILLDAAGQFREGTESAKLFMADGRSASLASRLPAQDHYAAWALDMKHPYAAALFEHFGNRGKGMSLPGDVSVVLDQVTGIADVIGVSPGGLTGGLLRRQVRYIETANPAGVVETLGQSVSKANNTAAAGMQMTSAFASGAKDVDGVSVATYELKLTPDPDAQPNGFFDAGQVMPMLFGGAGPRGYLAATDSGVIQTVSRHDETLQNAINSARFGEGLTTTKGLQSVHGAMPEARFAEFYLSVSEITNAVGPMAMFMGVLDDFQPIEEMAPVAGALVGTEGGLHARLVIPQQIIPTILSFVPDEQDPAMLEDEPEPRRGGPSF